jgi:hypothetical protein
MSCLPTNKNGDRFDTIQKLKRDHNLSIKNKILDFLKKGLSNPNNTSYGNESNFKRISDLQQEIKVKFGELNLDSENKISGFKNNTEENIVFSPEHVNREEANQIYNKSKKTKEDRDKLAIYFATYFVNRIQDVRTPLYLGFNRIQVASITKPIILITKDNKRENPFFQYNNMVVVGVDQLSKLIKVDDGISFEKWEETMDVVAQEEIIHLFADYLLDNEEIDAIYSEMTESDKNHIKSIYRNNNLIKDQIVHEYLRMVVQQEVFGKTTEEHTVTMSEYTLLMLSKLLDKIQEFLKNIIGGKNTTKAIEDLIAFTKGEFSEEFDTKLKNKVFKQGQVLESELQKLTNETPYGNENRIKQIEELFESNFELANSVYEAAGIPKIRLYRVYNSSAKGVVIEGQEKYTGQWFTTDLNYALSYVEKNKKVIKGQNVLDNKYDYSDLKVDVVELNPSEAKKYLLSQETVLKEKLDAEPDNFIIPSTITRSATINIGKEIGISNKVIKSFLPSEKDVFKKNIPLPTTSKFENLLQLEQQAQQLYSQYLSTIFPNSQVKDIVYRGGEKEDAKLFQYWTNNKAEAYMYAKAHITKGGKITERNPILVIANNLKNYINDKYGEKTFESYILNKEDYYNQISETEYEVQLPTWYKEDVKLDKQDIEDFTALQTLKFNYDKVKIEDEDDLDKPYIVNDYDVYKRDYDKARKQLDKYFNREEVGKIKTAILNIKNPYTEEIIQEDLENDRDAYRNGHDGAFLMGGDHFLVKSNTEQIHILLSKKDLEMFKNFINKNTKNNNQELEWQTNEIKLKTKYPEITYEDFVSLTDKERENLISCL